MAVVRCVVEEGEQHVHGLMNKVKRGKKRVVDRGWMWSESDSCGHQMLFNITHRVASAQSSSLFFLSLVFTVSRELRQG